MISSFSSFVNGFIAGAGAILAIVSAVLLSTYHTLEGIMGFTTIEIRAAIFLGSVVFVASTAYELYKKKRLHIS